MHGPGEVTGLGPQLQLSHRDVSQGILLLIPGQGFGSLLRDGDITGWRDQLSAINTQWIQPLTTALRNKTIDKLTLIACNSENLLATNVERADLWRLWRRARPLAEQAWALVRRSFA